MQHIFHKQLTFARVSSRVLYSFSNTAFLVCADLHLSTLRMGAGKAWLISRPRQPCTAPVTKSCAKCHPGAAPVTEFHKIWGQGSLCASPGSHHSPRWAWDHSTSKPCAVTESFNSCYSSKLHSMENCLAIIQIVKGGKH